MSVYQDQQIYDQFLGEALGRASEYENIGENYVNELQQSKISGSEDKTLGSELLFTTLPGVFPEFGRVVQSVAKIYKTYEEIKTKGSSILEGIKTLPADLKALAGTKIEELNRLVKEGSAESINKANKIYSDLQAKALELKGQGEQLVKTVKTGATEVLETAKSSVETAKSSINDIISSVQGDLTKITPSSIIDIVSKSYKLPEELSTKEGLVSNALNFKETAKATLQKLSDETDKQISDLKTKLETATDSEKVNINKSIQDLKDNYNNIGDSIKSKLAEVKQIANNRFEEIQNKARQVTEVAPETTPIVQTTSTIEKQIEEHKKIDPMDLESIDERLDWHQKLDDLNQSLESSKIQTSTPAPEVSLPTRNILEPAPQPTPELTPTPTPVIESKPTVAPEPTPAPAPVRQQRAQVDDDEGIQSAPRGVSYENARPVTSEPRPLDFTSEAIGFREARPKVNVEEQMISDRNEAIRLSKLYEPAPTVVSKTSYAKRPTESIGRSQNLTEVSEEFPMKEQLLESTAAKDLNVFSETGIRQTASNIFKSSGLDNPFSQLAKERETILNKPTTPYLTDAASETIIAKGKTAFSKIPAITEETTSALPEVASSLLSKVSSGVGGLMEAGGVAGGIFGTIQEAKGQIQTTGQKIQTGLGQEQALSIVTQKGAEATQAIKQGLQGAEETVTKVGTELQTQATQKAGQVVQAGKQVFGETEQAAMKAGSQIQSQAEQLAKTGQTALNSTKDTVTDLVQNVGDKSTDLLGSIAEKGILETLGEVTGISAIPVVGEIAGLGGLIWGAVTGIEDLFTHHDSSAPKPQFAQQAQLVHQAGI